MSQPSRPRGGHVLGGTRHRGRDSRGPPTRLPQPPLDLLLGAHLGVAIALLHDADEPVFLAVDGHQVRLGEPVPPGAELGRSCSHWSFNGSPVVEGVASRLGGGGWAAMGDPPAADLRLSWVRSWAFLL